MQRSRSRKFIEATWPQFKFMDFLRRVTELSVSIWDVDEKTTNFSDTSLKYLGFLVTRQDVAKKAKNFSDASLKNGGFSARTSLVTAFQ